uniref:Fibronectin type III and SPRY domain containing 2 n=1 Tax=Ornithorhynchus anatinus TaxID=9258 RepID=A0A6I8N777_ORNAN
MMEEGAEEEEEEAAGSTLWLGGEASLDPAGDVRPGGLTFYHMDLYDSQDGRKFFPEKPAGPQRGTSREMTGDREDGEGGPEPPASDRRREAEDPSWPCGLDGDEAGLPLGAAIAGSQAGRDPRLAHWPPPEEQDYWADPSEGEEEGEGMGGHGGRGSPGRLRESRDVYRCLRGRSSEDFECYVIPEEDDEEEAEDVFCVTCRTPIRAVEVASGEHKEHQISQLASAIETAKDEVYRNMDRLEEQIAQMENFASHLEEVFITVEENFGRQEQNFEVHYNEVLEALAQKYEEKIQALGEEKREKLEALYGQLVSCGENLDICKELMETTEEICHQEKVDFIKDAVVMADRLGEFLKTKTEVELSARPDFRDQTIDFSEVEQLMDTFHTVIAPSAPVINPQTPNSATGSTVKVCWSLFSDDTVEGYELRYKPVTDGTGSEGKTEFTMKVKETYCTVTDLLPNTQYEFWVTAVNSTGASPLSESAVYVTAPSPPIVKSQEICSCEHAALLRWESGNLNPVDSYTIEFAADTAGGDNQEAGCPVTESIVGIPAREALVQLQPNQSYQIHVRAINVGGPSERSRPVPVRTTGCYFYLNKDTAHPCLSISDDGFTILRKEGALLAGDALPSDIRFTGCAAVLARLIPVRGRHYWEVEVDGASDYTVGVAFEDVPRHDSLGANSSSWCMRHSCTSSRHKYEFLHGGLTPEIQITIPPRKIGLLLDYETCKLSFFNVAISQHLYTFSCRLRDLVHPCFSLEKPGSLKICNGVSPPKRSVSVEPAGLQ